MPDEIRTLTELDKDFEDNIENILSAGDIRGLVRSLIVHGEIYAANQTEITLGTGWQTVALDTAGLDYGIVADPVNYRLTMPSKAMMCEISYELNFLGGQNDLYEIRVIKNGSVEAPGMRGRITPSSTTRPVFIAASLTYNFAASDYVELQIQSNGNPFELGRGVLRAERVGVR